MPSFLWQCHLPKRASKIKRLLARHDIHLRQASGQVLSYTSAKSLENHKKNQEVGLVEKSRSPHKTIIKKQRKLAFLVFKTNL